MKTTKVFLRSVFVKGLTLSTAINLSSLLEWGS